eukprot:scaffold11198_cov103-Skeletonema_dohrnii-CCMP3373.AAC.11
MGGPMKCVTNGQKRVVAGRATASFWPASSESVSFYRVQQSSENENGRWSSLFIRERFITFLKMEMSPNI